MKNIVKNLSLRTQSVLKRGTVAMLCTILIGAGVITFHSCKKDEVTTKVEHGTSIKQEKLLYGYLDTVVMYNTLGISHCTRETKIILRDYITHKALSLVSFEWDIIDCDNMVFTAKFVDLKMELNAEAVSVLASLVEDTSEEADCRRAEVIRNFDNYRIRVLVGFTNVLLTPDYSKTIYIDEEEYVINYDYIRETVWQTIIADID